MSYVTDKIRARYNDEPQSALRTQLFDALDEIDRLYADKQQEPWPLFTRTAYTKEELYAHIDSLEQLGFTSYDIVRDVEELEFITNSIVKCAPPKRNRWIIKVYGTEEAE